MNNLESFTALLSGNFDNAQQYETLRAQGVADFPLARHVNTVCNDKILNLPPDFPGVFLVEESYYTIGETTRASAHLFLFTAENSGEIKLTSYEIPAGYDKSSFTYQALQPVEFAALKASEKFTPALYAWKGDAWEGGSVSMFSPVLKFTLFERFSSDVLEVSEIMEVNGKRTFGYDVPIQYRRIPADIRQTLRMR